MIEKIWSDTSWTHLLEISCDDCIDVVVIYPYCLVRHMIVSMCEESGGGWGGGQCEVGGVKG